MEIAYILKWKSLYTQRENTYILFQKLERSIKMRYGYNLNNPKEREMYFQKRMRDIKRQINKTDINKGLAEAIRETQEEMKYFNQNENNEKAVNKAIKEEIENKLPDIIEKELKEIFK